MVASSRAPPRDVQIGIMRAPEPPLLSEQRNRNLLRFVGVLYFLGGFSGASFGRFSTIFYLSPPRNFNAGQIGLIEAVGPPNKITMGMTTVIIGG